MTKLRILLADDHVVVREGLKALINRQPDMEVVGETGDGSSACEAAARLGAGRRRDGRLDARHGGCRGHRADQARLPECAGARPDRPRG